MKGMEMMLANMLGLKPAEMQAMFNGLLEMANSGAETIKRLESQNEEILSLLKGQENGNGDNGSSDN